MAPLPTPTPAPALAAAPTTEPAAAPAPASAPRAAEPASVAEPPRAAELKPPAGARPLGRIGRVLVANVQLFDEGGAQAGAVSGSALAIPPGGLPYYGKKGILLQINHAGRPVWVRETQVILLDERASAPDSGRSTPKEAGGKAISPGLGR